MEKKGFEGKKIKVSFGGKDYFLHYEDFIKQQNFNEKKNTKKPSHRSRRGSSR
jgi:hypothetical protein